jgi:hypothetical protein
LATAAGRQRGSVVGRPKSNGRVAIAALPGIDSTRIPVIRRHPARIFLTGPVFHLRFIEFTIVMRDAFTLGSNS